MSLINGNDKDVWDMQVKDISIEVQGHSMKLDFDVMHMSRADVVLGHEWLHGLGSSLSRSIITTLLHLRKMVCMSC